MASRRADGEGAAWGGSPIPALAGVDGVYLQRMDLSSMIGVMFTLLLILMVITPSLGGGLAIPRAPSAAVIPGERVTLGIDRDGRYFAGNPIHAVALADLAETLRPLLRDTEEPDVLYLMAHESVGYSSVLDAMAAARTAGVRHVALVAELPRPRLEIHILGMPTHTR